MASKKKRPAKKKGSANRAKPAAKKARPKKKARRTSPAVDIETIYVTYNQYAKSVELDPNDLVVEKRETIIYWMKMAGSDPITFTLDPSTDRCPFGKLTLDATSTKITLRYHGIGDRKKDWFYRAQVTSNGEVEISGGGRVMGGSTIKNH